MDRPDDMADDVVVQNLYNFICISGGFVELPVLLKNDSPLGSRISELDAKNSLTTQAGRPFVAVKDCYGDGITGVRIDLRKKICQQYIGKGSCRRAQGKCKFWHICKSFIEGNCAGKCNLSHNFFDEHNKTKAEELALEKFSNETIKNVVAWSLPQVCQLYLKNECKSDECLYLHVCATAVQGLEGGSPCHCPLSHSLIDSHNKKILKQYDLVPHPSMKVEFVRCSILVPKEQSVFDKSKCSREASATGGKVTNTPSSSKHGEYESSFQVKTGMDKKCRKRKPLQDKASEQEPICRPVGTINPVNKDSLEFLNTETGEKGNCMDPCSDEYKSANFSFKDVRHVKEGDLNAAKKGQKKPKMAAQSRDGAVKSKSAELDKDQEGRRTCNESHQRSLDCANAVKVSTKESKMITAQTSDGAVKSSEVMKVEKEQCGCLTRKDFQKKRLEDANAVNRCRPKSKMATAQSSDDAVKRNAKEVVEDKEVYQTRIESQQKRLQNGNVARSPQESKTTTKKLVGTANAKVKEGKKDQESGETRNASQQKRFQGENIVKKSSQESTMATTVANGQGGALTNTEFQQKILYDSNAVKSTRQKSKMTTAQSSDGAVKRNAKEVVKDKEDGQTRIESQQKILDSAVKVTGAEKAERDQYAGLTRNGLQQRSIHEANAVKRSWQKSNVTTSQSSDCAVKAKVMGVKKDGGSGNTCNGLQQRNLFDANAVKRSPQLQECNMTATQSSGDAVKANVREVQNDDGSGQACKESQERSLDQRHVVVQSSQQSITTTEKLSEAAKAKFKVVEEDEGIGQTRNKSHHRLDDANAVKKGRQGCKMSITEGLDSTVKGAVREVKKDQDYSQIRNESQQESLDHGHVMERISQESLTTTENLSEATKPKVKVKTKGREGGQSRKTSVQKSLGGTNSAKRHQQESRTNNNQSSDEAVKAKVKEVKKDERGDQTRRESRQKSLDDRNAVERGSHGFMTNAKTLSGAAKAKNVEEKRDQEGGNKSEHKSLDGTNALKRGRQETMSTTTLSSDELVKAKVKEVKRDREGSQIRIESQPKSLGGAHTMKNSRQKSVTTTQLSSDGAEKDHEGGQTRNESQQGIFDDEHAAMRSRQESKITTKSLTGAMKAKVKEGEKDHERSQIHNEIQQKGLDDVDAVQRSQLESKTTTKKLGGYFKATVEEVGIDSGVVPTHNEPLEKLLQDKNAGKRRRKKSKMTAQGFVTSIKEMQKCTEAYQTCSETKQKSLEASRDPKDVNTASETHVTGGQSDNPTMRAPGSELPSGLLTVDSSREFFNTSSSTLPASQEVYVDTQQNEPISSSCSSVQDPKKCTPSKKAVFECILKEYDGSVSFDAISKRQDLFPDGCGDIVSWFEARNDRFFLRKKEGTILEVSVFCRGAKLCFNQMCSKKDCQYFHVCKEYIAGFCRFGCGCQRNHSFQYDEDRKFISKRKLGGLTHEELRKVLKLSMPQVCFDYNEGCCTRGLSCNKIHICEDFTTSRCEGEEHCGLQHENAFVTLHTTAILRNYGLKLKDDNVNLVRKMLLFCEDIPSGYRNRPSSKIVACKDLSISSKGASAATSFEPSAVEVFECLCKEYNCSASLSVISKRTDLFPSAFDDIESWFRKKKDRFRITEDQQGEILQVHAFSTKARVCLGYNAYYGECKREKCPYLHVCRKYITNSSSNGASCPRNHHFQDEREKSLLSKFKFDQLTDEQLRRLVLSSTPRVCETPKLPIASESIPSQDDVDRWPHLKGIHVTEIEANVGLLIGHDVPKALEPKEVRESQNGGPYATRTLLGWAINGPLGRTGQATRTTNFVRTDAALDHQFQRFCNMEFNDSLLGSERAPSLEDRRALTIMETSAVLKEGHYEIALPWKCPPLCLPNNKPLAEHRLRLL